MTSYISQRGLAAAAVIIIVALVLIAAGAAYYVTSQPAVPENGATEETMMEASGSTLREDASPLPAAGGAAMPAPEEQTIEGESMPHYTGTVLAGTSAPLLDFNKADFDAAVASGKVVVLYFFANWCPICAEEFPKMQAAFNELSSDQVVGFRVNYNDNQTDADEQALAREHGVAYQHTKVFVQNDTQLLKSPETWTKDRYLTEITNAAAP